MSRRASLFALFVVGCAAPPRPAPTISRPEVRVSPRPDPEAWRRARPRVPPPQPIPSPAVRSFTLANGLSLYVVENHRLPLVTTNLVVRAGYAERAPGVARLVLSSVARSSKTVAPHAFADELAALGATVSTKAHADYATLTVEALAEHWPETMRLVADAVLHPDLGEAQLASVRKELTSELAARSHNDGMLAFDLLVHALYGDHPYGWSALSHPHAYERLTARDAQRFYDDYWQPSDCALVVVGDVVPERARAALDALFGSWQRRGSEGSRPALPAPAAPPPAKIMLVDRPSATQATVLAAARVGARSAPDWYSTVVANRILGGGFDSRLNTMLRAKKGYSYAIRSMLFATAKASLLYSYSAVRLDKAGDAVKEILDEFDGLRLRPPAADELQTAKDSCRLGGALELETNGDVATALASRIAFDLPTTELNERFARLAQVALSDVEAIATDRLTSLRTSVVIVGPAATLKEQLQRQGLTAIEVTPPR